MPNGKEVFFGVESCSEPRSDGPVQDAFPLQRFDLVVVAEGMIGSSRRPPATSGDFAYVNLFLHSRQSEFNAPRTTGFSEI